jgi:hypothetical protein
MGLVDFALSGVLLHSRFGHPADAAADITVCLTDASSSQTVWGDASWGVAVYGITGF